MRSSPATDAVQSTAAPTGRSRRTRPRGGVWSSAWRSWSGTLNNAWTAAPGLRTRRLAKPASLSALRHRVPGCATARSGSCRSIYLSHRADVIAACMNSIALRTAASRRGSCAAQTQSFRGRKYKILGSALPAIQTTTEQVAGVAGLLSDQCLNCMFKPTKTCQRGHIAPLSATDTCGSTKTLSTADGVGITWPMPNPIGTLYV